MTQTDHNMAASLAAPSDEESRKFLSLMTEQDRIRGQRLPGIRTVLVVLSAAGMVYDMEALQQKILLSYPEAVTFFVTTNGKPLGVSAPKQIDLLIDFTGPRQRQSLFFAKRLRRMARIAIGRNAGLFRKRLYDRTFDEKALRAQLPGEHSSKERKVQREVLALAGIPFSQTGDTPADRGLTIALDLPPMRNI